MREVVTKKLVRVGNSYALIILQWFIKEVGWKVGQELDVELDIARKRMIVRSVGKPISKEEDVLTKLAKK